MPTLARPLRLVRQGARPAVSSSCAAARIPARRIVIVSPLGSWGADIGVLVSLAELSRGAAASVYVRSVDCGPAVVPVAAPPKSGGGDASDEARLSTRLAGSMGV